MTDFESFRENCLKLRERVAAAESAAASKPGEVKILPVTKNHPIDAVAYAAKLGFKGVGENRVQEAVEKIKSSSLEIEWELIGHLQTNKAKIAAKYFSRIQSLDSAR